MQQLLKIFDQMDGDVVDAISTLFRKKIIEFDEKENKLIFNVDMVFKFKGNVEFDCDKHVIINSGQVEDKEMNHPYAIWLNPAVDDDGNMVLDDA